MPVLVPQAAYLFCIHQHKTALEEEINQFSFLLGESLNPWTTAMLGYCPLQSLVHAAK